MVKCKTPQADNDQSIGQIVEIIRFMGENKLAELDLETSQMKLKLRKHSASQIQSVIPAQPHLLLPTNGFRAMQAPQALQVTSLDNKKQKETSSAIEDKYHKILSPMTGTFYAAPSPTSEPFVKVGSTVEVGQIICYVEAMKLMNEIKTDKAGKVVKIVAENGKLVEKSHVLIQIGD